MTIQELHVGIDLGVQRLDSNIFGNIQKPEKDYYINMVIDQLLRAVILEERNTVFSLLTYGDITEYYEACQAHIVRKYLAKEDMLGEGYVRCKLPVTTVFNNISSGNLINGNSYVITVSGTTDFSRFGYTTNPPVVGDTFKVDIPNIVVGRPFSLILNAVYKIVNAGNIDFVSVGAADNEVDTIFTSNSNMGYAENISTELEIVSEPPIWDGTTTLNTLVTDDYYLYMKSDTHTEYGSPIASGTIRKGNKYKVLVIGSTDLSDFGGYIVNGQDLIFACTMTGEPTWTQGTVLKQVKPQPNRLFKEQDVTNALTNSFGTVITSPIVTIRDYGLDVFYTEKFTVDDVNVSYIRKPQRVAYDTNITTDLPESVHAKLVGLIVAYIAADLDPQSYAIKKDKAMSSDNEQTQRRG